jgi:hypothetical protein
VKAMKKPTSPHIIYGKTNLLAVPMFFLFLLTTATAFECGDAEIWWTLDNTADDSCSPFYNATNNGASWVAAMYGQGADLERSETDRLYRGTGAYQTGTNRTISVWVKPESIDTSMIIASKRGSTSADSHFFIQQRPSNDFRCQAGDGTYSNVTDSTTLAVAGTWFHIVCVYDTTNSNISIWVNGSYESSAGGHSNKTNAAHLFIGCLGVGSSCSTLYYDGIIDEFVYFNKTLSAAEISNMYQYNNASGLPAPLNMVVDDVKINGVDSPSVNPTESSDTAVTVEFNVSHENGAAWINVSTAYVNDTTDSIVNTTCQAGDFSDANTTEIECLIYLHYYTVGGTKNLEVYAADNTTTTATDANHNFTYNTIYTVDLNISTLDFGFLSPSSNNNEAVLNINNTGNGVVNVTIKGADLTNGSNILGIGNATVDDDGTADEGVETGKDEMVLTTGAQDYSPTAGITVQGSVDWWFFLDIPAGQVFGSYTSASSWEVTTSQH